MKNYAKILFLFSFLALGVYFHSYAKASYSQTSYNGTIQEYGGSGQLYYLDIGNSTYTQLATSSTAYIPGFYANGSANLGNFTQINDFSFLASGFGGIVHWNITCVDGSGTHNYTSDNMETFDTTRSVHKFTFTNAFCDSSTLIKLQFWNNNTGWSYGEPHIVATNDSSVLEPGVGVEGTANGVVDYSYNLAVAINTDLVATNASPIIGLTSPKDTAETADFQNWDVNLNITTGCSGTGCSYYVKIHYGTSTSTMTTVDDSSQSFGYFPIDSLPAVFNNLQITKTATSTVGTYYVYETLHRHSVLFGDSGIATSSITSFSIIPGTRQITAGELLQSIPNCPATPFQIFGVDFGQGLCSQVRWWIVPNFADLQTSLNNFNQAYTTRIPFSYLAQFQGAISSASTSTATTTLLNFRMKIDAAGIDIQEHWLDVNDSHFQTVWTYPKQILSYGMWILLFYYLVNRAISIFRTESQ